MNTETFTTIRTTRHAWRALFWEPVAGTGERIMVGVVHSFEAEVGATRLIRDDVLESLFGKAAPGVRRLVDGGLEIYRSAAEAGGIEVVGVSMFGLHAGELRATPAKSLSELLHTAALLYSSLAKLDKLDEMDEDDAPQQEEVNRQFKTELRDHVQKSRPDLLPYFGKSGTLVDGGQKVKFGYFSPKAVLHFSVISAVRQPAGVKDARAKFFELHRAREISGINVVALLAAVPRLDDPTLGSKQQAQLRLNLAGMEQEANSMNMRWFPVTSSDEGAERLIEIVD